MPRAPAPRERKRRPGLPRGGKGWLNGSGGGGEREPRAFGEPKGEVEKGWVDDRIERLRTDSGL